MVHTSITADADVRRERSLRSVARRWSSRAVGSAAQPRVSEEPNNEKEEPR